MALMGSTKLIRPKADFYTVYSQPVLFNLKYRKEKNNLPRLKKKLELFYSYFLCI